MREPWAAPRSEPRVGAGSATAALAVAARVGYLARGSVYLIIGAFAFLAAVGSGTRTVGNTGVAVALLAQPAGRVLLGLLALGLICFSLWRALQAFADAEHHGRSLIGLARRGAYVAGALFYFGLAAWAFSVIAGWSAGRRSEDKPIHDWTAWLLSLPFGRWLVALAGAVLVGTALAFAFKAFSPGLQTHLSAQAGGWMVLLGRIGFLARAVAFALMGSFLVEAAIHANSRAAKGLAGALRSLEQQPYGWILLGLTAAGFIAFGAYELVQAGYRKVDVPKI